MLETLLEILHGVRSGMANIQLQPPVNFNFNNPDEWPQWKLRFEQYRLASGQSKEAQESQVSALLYCLGEDAKDV